jgi:tetratricopeptide (TPR) repeat protein
VRTGSLLILSCAALLALAPAAPAGLYYSSETVADLPSQWRGYLTDQRLLRTLAVPPKAGAPAHPLREAYQQAVGKLEQAARQRPLSADEEADLGALLVRLGRTAEGVERLRTAQRAHPDHFRTAANLGTAWQVRGDLDQAAVALQQAVRLAPPKLRPAEELQLKLVRQRQRQPADRGPDDLFGVRYAGEPGKLAEAELKKLPDDAVALLQQLGLWLPADGRLLWQMGELANASGDVKTAAAILDGCVTEFGMSEPDLRRHRQAYRTAADEQAAGGGSKTVHEGQGHRPGVFRSRSPRPLVHRFDPKSLPEVRADAANPLPWEVLADTTLDGRFKPTFPAYLRQLDGKRVTMSGFMQPIGEELEVAAFLFIEYPVGCWFCETPETTGIVFVELPAGKSMTLKRSLVKVEGVLKLNDKDPEEFLYTIRDARVGEAD